MNAGQLLLFQSDVVTLLRTSGILRADGTFDATKLDTVAEDVAFGMAVEKLLIPYGITAPEKVQRFIDMLPLIASFFS
jgi:hypothetical protein